MITYSYKQKAILLAFHHLLSHANLRVTMVLVVYVTLDWKNSPLWIINGDNQSIVAILWTSTEYQKIVGLRVKESSIDLY